MLRNAFILLNLLFLATLGTADPFSDCLARQLLSNENGFVVEDATAQLLEAMTQLSIESLKEEDVTLYVNELVEVDCSSVQTSIDTAISSDDSELVLSYLTAALMESIHTLDSLESAIVSTGGNRRELFGAPIATSLAIFALIQEMLRRITGMIGRRLLSMNTDGIISFTPTDVLKGCANGAPSSVCSLDLSALAGDFSGTFCGGTTDAFTCDISVESINAALFEVIANAWSVPLNP